MSEKLCVFCKHWDFNGGEPGYSEMTPGIDTSMGCRKGKYGRRFRLDDIYSERGFREHIKQAESCDSYEVAKDE